MQTLKPIHAPAKDLAVDELALPQAHRGRDPRLPEQPRAPDSITNPEELRTFVEKNMIAMFKRAKVFCYGNVEEAREIVQELYPRMVIVLEHSQSGVIAYPWSCALQILARLAIDRYRKERRTRARIKRLEFPDSIPDDPPQQRASDKDLEELCRALESLSSRSKAIVAGIFLDGCKAKDIAARLGISESRLSELKNLALKQLREVLA